jgi:NAD(P)-dependent dehydrogenase (short-subunit alcohol dehydrogenase family)
MLLEGKNAIIYGGGGSIGGAVARAFAREGATVHLVGRTLETLERVADEIRSAGGAAETAVVDALDEGAVDRHADRVAAQAGGIDISFNLITHPHTHGIPLAEMAVDDFMAPVEVAARTTFLTARAAARHMIPGRSGVILAFGGPGDRSGPMRDYYLGGDAGRLRRDRDDPPAARCRARAARNPRRHTRERRGARVAPGGLRGSRGDRRADRGADPPGASGQSRGRRQCGRVRRLRLGPHHDGGDRQRELRSADGLAARAVGAPRSRGRSAGVAFRAP